MFWADIIFSESIHGHENQKLTGDIYDDIAFLLGPASAYANPDIKSSSVIKCARSVEIIHAKEKNQCFGLVEETDGSLGLIEKCGTGQAMSTRAFFVYDEASQQIVYSVAPDFNWTPCPYKEEP